MDFSKLEEELIRISEEVGSMIRSSQEELKKEDVREKKVHDLVTSVDEKAERLFVESLSELLPEAGFITEEGTRSDQGAEYDWVIDPLDGTTNFVHGIPSYCTSVALIKDGNPVLGVVHEVVHRESFHAIKGEGARMNGDPISVSPNEAFGDSLIVTGFPGRYFERIEAYMEVFKELLLKTRGARRLGSAAADLCYVACGRFDVFYEFGLKPWDVAAGALIVEEAGGRVTDFSLGRDAIFGREIIASNGNVHAPFYELFSRIYPVPSS
ncbi:MAG: inositol monophosphatase family protein [Flavobacteriales bacterium]